MGFFILTHTFKEVCNDFYANIVEGDTWYLGFTHVKMSDIVDIEEIRDEIPQMRILYDHSQEALIMKIIGGRSHEMCRNMFSSILVCPCVVATGKM